MIERAVIFRVAPLDVKNSIALALFSSNSSNFVSMIGRFGGRSI
jgi:hypothetical protein